MTENKCFYCNINYSKNTEHVFPDGLGGQRLFMLCVCPECNNRFSSLERELYQKGVAGLIRSVEGITSQKKQNKKNYFKAPVLLLFDEDNKIVYEANQSEGLDVFLKSQIIEINSDLYLEGSDEKQINLFIDKVKRWKNESLILITRYPNNSNTSFGYTEFQINDKDITHKEFDSSEKLKHTISVSILNNHELSPYLKPRLFLDNENKLKVRAQSKEKAILFINQFLNSITRNKTFKSYSKIISPNRTVHVVHSFNPLKSEQAMVKIILNCLLHYYPLSKNNPNLSSAKDFVNGKPSNLNRFLDKKNKIIDSCEKSHNIFFHQSHNYLNIRLSLFNGHICYSIIIPELKILSNNAYTRLVIDYSKRQNRLETQQDFLMSFK